jgi:hypothetical protein
MSAEIIPFARYRCDCPLCRAIAEVWNSSAGPIQTLESFLAENAHLLPRGISPCTALGIIAQRGSRLSRSLARTILDKARAQQAPGITREMETGPMPLEQPELFHVEQPGRVRRDGYAQRPIGRRRSRRFSRTSQNPRDSTIRALLETHSTLLLDIGTAIEKLIAEVITSHGERRRIGEQLDRLLRSQTETRRQLGQTQLHILPHHTRRRPLGLD